MSCVYHKSATFTRVVRETKSQRGEKTREIQPGKLDGIQFGFPDAPRDCGLRLLFVCVCCVLVSSRFLVWDQEVSGVDVSFFFVPRQKQWCALWRPGIQVQNSENFNSCGGFLLFLFLLAFHRGHQKPPVSKAGGGAGWASNGRSAVCIMGPAKIWESGRGDGPKPPRC